MATDQLPKWLDVHLVPSPDIAKVSEDIWQEMAQKILFLRIKRSAPAFSPEFYLEHVTKIAIEQLVQAIRALGLEPTYPWQSLRATDTSHDEYRYLAWVSLQPLDKERLTVSVSRIVANHDRMQVGTWSADSFSGTSGNTSFNEWEQQLAPGLVDGDATRLFAGIRRHLGELEAHMLRMDALLGITRSEVQMSAV